MKYEKKNYKTAMFMNMDMNRKLMIEMNAPEKSLM